MFEYDKIFKKLKELDKLPKKKQKKVLNNIFSEEFKTWFYGASDNNRNGQRNDAPNTNTMIRAIIAELARPKNIKILTKYIDNKNYDEFDHTSCCISYVVISQSIMMLNDSKAELSNNIKESAIGSKHAKLYKEKIEDYNNQIRGLVSAVQDKCAPFVKKIAHTSNLPKELIMATQFLVPSPKYIQKYRINGMMEELLREIYRFTGSHGIEDVYTIKWHPYFAALFGENLTASTALSVVMEGVRRIDAYRDLPHFDSVREIWDSLTKYGMKELNDAPEDVRCHMLDIYVKRAERIYRSGNARLRVDFLNIPLEYERLNRSMQVYKFADKLAKIVGKNFNREKIDRDFKISQDTTDDKPVRKSDSGHAVEDNYNDDADDDDFIDTSKLGNDDEDDDDD